MVYLAASVAQAAAPTGTGDAPRRAARLEEHWNWPAGSTMAISGHTNCEDVTLTLNGQPIGTRAWAGAVDGVLRWDVPWQPGVLKAVARTNGKPVAEFSLTTAGAAARIALMSDVVHRQERRGRHPH